MKSQPIVVGAILLLKRGCLLILILLVALSSSAQQSAKVTGKHGKVFDFDANSVSADGRLLAYTDWETGRLAIRDLETGKSRHLTSEGWPKAAYSPQISPDGKHIAFTFYGGGVDQLRMIGTDGSGERVIYGNDDQRVTWIEPHDWSPDGRYIVAVLTTAGMNGPRQIALFPVTGEPPRILKNLPRAHSPTTVCFSPDGHYIAFDLPADESSWQRDLFVLSLETGSSVALVRDPANDLLLGWGPDSKMVLFARELEGAWDLWAIPVSEDGTRGPAELVRSGLRPVAGALGLTRGGSLYYLSRTWVNDLYVANFDSRKARFGSPSKLVSQVAWESSPAFSPDGKQLAYVLQHGSEGFGSLLLVARPLESARARQIPLKIGRFGGHAFQPQWSSDGRYLLVQGRDEHLRQGLFRIEVESGVAVPVVLSDTPCPMDRLEWPVWSPEGKVLFNRWVRRSIVSRDPTAGEEKEIYSDLPSRVSHLGISSDGQRLAFVMRDRQTAKTLLKVMPAWGGEAVDLVELPAAAAISAGQPAIQLAWTPDSRHLLYAVGSSGPNPKLDFWRISVRGGAPEHLGLTLEGLLPYGLSIHPDGRSLDAARLPSRLQAQSVNDQVKAEALPRNGLNP